MRIPEKGMKKEALFEKMESFREGDVTWRDGRTWAYVYDPGPEVEAVIKQAYTSFLSENALDPTVFPSLLRFENEVISMAASHLRGDQEVVGNFTSGGTESIILAMKTARDYAKDKRGIESPEVVLPETAHAAFHKAGHYLGMKLIVTPVDPKTYEADVQAMRDAVTSNTVMLIGSAISYAHGVVDPIREIGNLALEKNLLCHVDGCMGGFLLPYFRRLGEDVPDFDFEVPGVTSISMDLHKYAFAAKGASVILYKNKSIRKYQIYACARWTGYTVVNSTVQSAKTGGPLAAAWAVLNFIGDQGYLEMARQMLEGTKRIVEGIESIDGLDLMVKPTMNLLAFTSDVANVFDIADEMTARGWYVQPQLGFGDARENIHLSINPNSIQWVDDLLKDFGESLEIAKAKKSEASSEMGSIGDMIGDIDFSGMDDDMFSGLMGMVGVEDNQLPEKRAEINSLLNVMPAEVKEMILIHFMNNLFRQPES